MPPTAHGLPFTSGSSTRLAVAVMALHVTDMASNCHRIDLLPECARLNATPLCQHHVLCRNFHHLVSDAILFFHPVGLKQYGIWHALWDARRDGKCWKMERNGGECSAFLVRASRRDRVTASGPTCLRRPRQPPPSMPRGRCQTGPATVLARCASPKAYPGATPRGRKTLADPKWRPGTWLAILFFRLRSAGA